MIDTNCDRCCGAHQFGLLIDSLPGLNEFTKRADTLGLEPKIEPLWWTSSRTNGEAKMIVVSAVNREWKFFFAEDRSSLSSFSQEP